MKRVAIFGATSAIAAEVAALCVARGDQVHLLARSESKLDALRMRLNSEQLSHTLVDFDDLAAGAQSVAHAIDALGGLDMVLIAHGLLGDQLLSESDAAHAQAILHTNLLSVVSLLIPLANHLDAAGAGTLAVITSVAGDRGRPRNYTYGAAKGALNIYLQGLRTRLYPRGVHITTLKLGPVHTPMTTDHPKNSLFAQPHDVAREILEAMDGGRAEVYVPAKWAAIMGLVKNAPEFLVQRLPFLSGR